MTTADVRQRDGAVKRNWLARQRADRELHCTVPFALGFTCILLTMFPVIGIVVWLMLSGPLAIIGVVLLFLYVAPPVYIYKRSVRRRTYRQRNRLGDSICLECGAPRGRSGTAPCSICGTVARCDTCGYELTGLGESAAICPECSAPIP